MAERPSDLPDFRDPPVVEVVLGVQFDAVRDLRQSHFGLIWDRIRQDYPRTTDHARLDSPIIALELDRAGPSFQLEMLDSPPTHRSWFLSADDERLVQIQDDRVVHNWRHRGGPYPRFEPIQEQFWTAFKAYRDGLAEVGIAAPSVRQVEVTYVNWIASARPADFLRTVTRAPTNVPGIGPEPDAERWLGQYSVIADDATIGRLTIEAKPGARSNDGEIQSGYLLSLTYVGPTTDPADELVDDQLVRGRDVIVRAFADVTEPTMHTTEGWGRTS